MFKSTIISVIDPCIVLQLGYCMLVLACVCSAKPGRNLRGERLSMPTALLVMNTISRMHMYVCMTVL